MKKNILLITFLSALYANATLISVPADYSAIQAAINASANSDTIAVSPGIYYENINFRGKNILLTSLYYLSNDTSYISSTVIDGSQPVNADTASCVIFNSGEDSTAILQGFTITGGTGTKWLDIHGAGVYREGGGVLIELSSPTVRCNIIRNNFATNSIGVSGAGGGGLRIGDGNPHIENNLIIDNQGRYGAGMVLNYTGCIVRNNVIASNSGGQTFNGGSGLWILQNLGTTPKIIENNTIVNNFSTLSTGTGGIFVSNASNVILRNNIVWGNLPALQIKAISAAPSVTYSDVQGGYAGTGNINTDPLFDPNCYYLIALSPCVDAGDTAAQYNDIAVSGFAVFPSMGTERNDMGAYGGPRTEACGCTATALTVSDRDDESSFIRIFPNPIKDVFTISISNQWSMPDSRFEIIDLSGRIVHKQKIYSVKTDVNCKLSSGLYFIKVIYGMNEYVQKIARE
jgi:hypothetical protein